MSKHKCEYKLVCRCNEAACEIVGKKNIIKHLARPCKGANARVSALHGER